MRCKYMDFVDENANVGLFIVLVIIVVIFLGLAVFYQQSFGKINDRYNSKLGELNKTFSELNLLKSRLTTTTQDLELKQKREEDLSDVYSKTKSEKDILEADKHSLALEVNQLQNQVNSLNITVKQLQDSLGNKEEKINELETMVDTLNDKVDCYRAGNANC